MTLEATESTKQLQQAGLVKFATRVAEVQEARQIVEVGKLLWKDAVVPKFVETPQEEIE